MLSTSFKGVILGLFGLWIGFVQIRKLFPRSEDSYQPLVRLIAASCLIAIFFEFNQIGPPLIIYHAVDFGFPVLVALIPMEIARGTGLRQNSRDLWALGVGFVLSCLYERFVHDVARAIGAPESWTAKVGQFDWIDVMLYTLGTASALGLLITERAQLKKRTLVGVGR